MYNLTIHIIFPYTLIALTWRHAFDLIIDSNNFISSLKPLLYTFYLQTSSTNVFQSGLVLISHSFTFSLFELFISCFHQKYPLFLSPLSFLSQFIFKLTIILYTSSGFSARITISSVHKPIIKSSFTQWLPPKTPKNH